VTLEPHRTELVALAYRMTGDHGAAEDLVQEAFVRALTRPPPDVERSLRPWLTRVVANLARDVLRRRRRRGYVGPWLPTPVSALPSPDDGPEARARAAQVVSWAMLMALEVLTPQQRVVWVLREVGELSAVDVAEMLDATAQAVRAAHTRARRALRAAGAREPVDLEPAMALAMQQLSAAVLADDLPALKALLVADARMASDGGGEVRAAIRVVHGPERVAKLLLGLARHNAGATVGLVPVNDRWAVEVHVDASPGFASLSLMLLTLASDGRIAGVQLVSAPSKLAAYRSR